MEEYMKDGRAIMRQRDGQIGEIERHVEETVQVVESDFTTREEKSASFSSMTVGNDVEKDLTEDMVTVKNVEEESPEEMRKMKKKMQMFQTTKPRLPRKEKDAGRAQGEIFEDRCTGDTHKLEEDCAMRRPSTSCNNVQNPQYADAPSPPRMYKNCILSMNNPQSLDKNYLR